MNVYVFDRWRPNRFRLDRRLCSWKGGRIEVKLEPDLRAILAGWIHEIVQAQPPTFRVLPEADRNAILELEITRRLFAECDADPELHRAFCEFLRLRKWRN
jgi:hypothetical protein